LETGEPTPFTPEQQRRSRKLLIAFFAGILLTAAAFVTSGFLMRDWIREQAGPFSVRVKNESTLKLRADVIVAGAFDDKPNKERRPLTLEMDPGEHGLLRYKLRKETLVRIDLYEKNRFIHSVAEGPFDPSTRGELLVALKNEDDVSIEFLPSEPPKP